MKKCPQCAEKVQDDAKVCRHCGYTFTSDELAKSARGKTVKAIMWIGVIVLLIALFKCGADVPAGAPTASRGTATAVDAESQSVAAGNSIELKRFAWDNRGSQYCKASATITNTSAESLTYLKLTLQFLKNDQLVASAYSYAEIKDLAPGQQTTWDDMYECPGAGTTVEITASSNEGGVAVNDPPKKPKAKD